ncbi:MAG TPA: flavin reductase [Acetobacteraceae bacterium]|nr:flavin reductase [Acetobacteraceae bacterium]
MRTRADVVTRQSFRDAMARFGAAVSVVTTDGPAGRRGFTASAVCSVTDDPPTLLVCVNRQNESHAALLANGVLCVNTLAAGQQDISSLFGGAVADHEVRFSSGTWYALETGAPVLQGAVVSFDCRIGQVTEIGTHSVIFGHVQAIRHGSVHDGLIYFGRGYHPVRRPAAAG